MKTRRAQTYSGVEIVDPKLEPLRASVEGWISAHVRYCDAWNGSDAMYWYNERANIGALAAGAWLSKYLAIEEFATVKGAAEGPEGQHGRADLYIGDEDKFGAALEAKVCWMAPTNKPVTLGNVLVRAVGDAARNALEHKMMVGVAFYVPRVRHELSSRENLLEQCDRIRELKPDLLAWCFPGSVRHLAPARSTDKHPGYVRPGVIMAMRRVRRKGRARPDRTSAA